MFCTTVLDRQFVFCMNVIMLSYSIQIIWLSWSCSAETLLTSWSFHRMTWIKRILLECFTHRIKSVHTRFFHIIVASNTTLLLTKLILGRGQGSIDLMHKQGLECSITIPLVCIAWRCWRSNQAALNALGESYQAPSWHEFYSSANTSWYEP